LLVVSCIVELAMALPMAVYFHRITVFALPVNILILPLLAVLMPAALLTLLASFVSTGVAAIPAAATALLLHAGVGLVRMFGSVAVGDFRIPAPLPLQVAAFCFLLGVAIALARRGNVTDARWQGRLTWVAMIAAGVVVVMPRPIERPNDALLVEAIDVGQGDSLLLITPEGKTMLVDGGGFGGGPRQAAQDFDIGEEVVSPTLWSRGIRHLDVVALSHAHSDHMGGLASVLRNFRPNELWVGDNPAVDSYKALLDEARLLRVQVRAMRAGDTAMLGSAEIHVLAPLANYEPGAEPSNNDSLVLHVSWGAASVLLEGDAEAPIERGMLGEQGLESTLLKVGHHGSITSTRPEFLARIAPRWAVISCGMRNRYGHPREEVLAELQASHVRTLSTDINGASCFELDGTNVKASAFCGVPGW
jgi:competence protein ComEC